MKRLKFFAFLTVFFLLACSRPPTPTETLQTYYDASKRADTETMKKCLSKTSLSLLALTARHSGVSPDKVLTPQYVDSTRKHEILGEQINGDTAIVNIKDGDKIVAMPFIKEDGLWKIALEKASDLQY